jgi:glycosyltransferase involved in cell wall biosynthesis
MSSNNYLERAMTMDDGDNCSYSVFDGLHWNSNRGMARFATQLRKHLARMPWESVSYSKPRWHSPIGRVLISEIVEPFWRGVFAPEVAFYPHNILPFLFLGPTSLRVLVLYDLLFLKRGSARSAGNYYRRLKLKHSLSKADLIITVSSESRDEIQHVLPGHTKILVIPCALAEGFNATNDAKRQTEEPRLANIFHFGGHVPTKNTERVFKAVALLNRRGHQVRLVLGAMAGNKALAEKWRQQAGLSSQALTVLPALSDEEVREIYANADVHCMPSSGEGFGIPVIEAARCGTPNVLSPLPVFREVIGEDAVYADSLEAESIAEAILKCLSTDVRGMIERARVRSERYLFEAVHRLDAVPALEEIKSMAMERRKA